MTLTDRMMQRRHSIHIRRIDGAFPVFQQDVDDGRRPDRCGAVERQLAALVFDSRAAFVGY